MRTIITELSSNGFPTALSTSGDVYLDKELITNLQLDKPNTTNSLAIINFGTLVDNNKVIDEVNNNMGRIGIDTNLEELPVLGGCIIDILKYTKEI